MRGRRRPDGKASTAGPLDGRPRRASRSTAATGERRGGDEGSERRSYAALFGPTTGDRIRLADTNLLIEIEQDLAAAGGTGDEAVFGGGKVIRESMGQSP